MLTKEIEKTKREQIEDFKSTQNVLEHTIAFENLSLGCQELLTKHVQYCEMRVATLRMELSSAVLADTIYQITNPNNYAHV